MKARSSVQAEITQKLAEICSKNKSKMLTEVELFRAGLKSMPNFGQNDAKTIVVVTKKEY